MRTAWRLASGAVLAGILMYLGLSLLPDVAPWAAFVVTMAIGLLGAVVARSWWAVVFIPIAVMVGRELWSATACAQCPVHDEDTMTLRLLLNVPFFGAAAALGAAAGTLLTRCRRGSPETRCAGSTERPRP